jgi:hypothetical protein
MFTYGALYSRKAAEFCGLGGSMLFGGKRVPEIRKLLLYPPELRGRGYRASYSNRWRRTPISQVRP